MITQILRQSLDAVTCGVAQDTLIDWPAWIQAGAAVLAAIVGLILLRQLTLLKDQVTLTREQMESAVHWNKLNAAFTYYNSDLVLRRESDAADALGELGINFHTQREPLTLAQVEAIVAKPAIYARVKTFLSLIEDYCTAVRIGAIDEDAAFAMNSGLIMRWEKVFEPFILHRQVEMGDSEAFCEIEKLAGNWRKKDDIHAAKHALELAAAKQRLDSMRDVQRKV